jgi:hypothetical protein
LPKRRRARKTRREAIHEQRPVAAFLAWFD